MVDKKKLLIGAGALGIVGVTGFLMQAATTAASPDVLSDAVVDQGVMAQAAAVAPEPERATETEIEISEIAHVSSLPEDARAPRPLAAPSTAPRLAMTPTARPESLPKADKIDTDCPVTMQAEATLAALVTLSFHSPCDPATRVTFHHEGLSFTERTDSMGRIELTVPALAERARFSAQLPTGDAAVAIVPVSSIAFYDRTVLQSEGRTGMELHALEFGAAHGEDGHVWIDAPRNPAVAARGEGGFFMSLGDPTLSEGRLAQVYTFPSGTVQQTGGVALSVEAEVLIETCSRDVRASVMQVNGGVSATPRDIAIQMPGCDAVGDYLLLKTPVNDLKIASR